MTPIPLKVRRELEQLERMTYCCRYDEGNCSGQLEWNHAMTGMGQKQIQEVWAIYSTCYFHHRGAGKDDKKARYIALREMSDEQLMRYKLGDQLIIERDYLKNKYDPLDNPRLHQ